MTAEDGTGFTQVVRDAGSLGRFRLGSKAPRQPAHGTSYEALAPATRTVATVTLLPNGSDSGFAERFLSEVEQLAETEHPALPRVLDRGRTEDGAWFATSPIEGPSLREIIDAGGALGPMRAVRLLGDVADALEAIHAAGLLHRRLGAGAVLVRELPIERPLLWDLALGRPAVSPDGSDEPGYRSPEELRGAPATPASDHYALACLLFEALTGSPPGERRSGPALPPGLERILAAGLAEDPAQRPASARKLLSETARILVSGESGSTTESPAPVETETESPAAASSRPAASSSPRRRKRGGFLGAHDISARPDKSPGEASPQPSPPDSPVGGESQEERSTARERRALERRAREQAARDREEQEREERERALHEEREREEREERERGQREERERRARAEREEREREREHDHAAREREREASAEAAAPAAATAEHAATEERTPARARPAEPSARPGKSHADSGRRRRPALIALALILIVTAGVIGFLAGRTGEDKAARPGNATASAGPLSVDVPASWERSEEAPPAGPPLREPISAEEGGGRLSAGVVEPAGGVLYPRETATRALARPSTPEAVRLGRLEAWRFSGAPRSGQGRTTLFLAPTSAGMLAVSCTAPPSAGADFLPACERGAATLSTDDDVRPVALSSLSPYAARADRVLRRLAATRRRDRRALGRAPLRRTQARVARRLVRSYRGAAKQLGREVPRAARRQVRDLVGALRRAAAGYSALARAAERTDRRRYRAASRAVRSAEATAARATARL